MVEGEKVTDPTSDQSLSSINHGTLESDGSEEPPRWLEQIRYIQLVVLLFQGRSDGFDG